MTEVNTKNKLSDLCKSSIYLLEELWKMIEKEKIKNEQFVLDWLDSLNKISIRN